MRGGIKASKWPTMPHCPRSWRGCSGAQTRRCQLVLPSLIGPQRDDAAKSHTPLLCIFLAANARRTRTPGEPMSTCPGCGEKTLTG